LRKIYNSKTLSHAMNVEELKKKLRKYKKEDIIIADHAEL